MQNLSEFRSGADYDAQYDHLYDPEIAYLTQMALGQKGAILDVCCGTGIVTIPLAEKTGFEVHGVDVAEDMLAVARAKSQHLHNSHFHLADALDFHLDQQFTLSIMTGNAFQAFLTEENAVRLLQNIHQHLSEGGLLIFDTRLLEGTDLTIDTDFKLKSEYIDAAGNDVRYFWKKTRFDDINNILYFDKKRQYPDGKEVFSGIELKFFPLKELYSLFERVGFEVLHQFSNWQMSPFDPVGSGAVFVLQNG